MTLTATNQFRSAPRIRTGGKPPGIGKTWYGVALFCAVMAGLLAVSASLGGLEHPVDPDMVYVSP